MRALRAGSQSFGLMKKRHLSIEAGTATSKKPTIISS
jgi:hypothetical protein